MTIKVKKLFLFAGILTGVLTACLGLETQHENHLGWALLFCGTALIAVGGIILGVLFLKEPAEGQQRDRSLWLPLFGVLAISLITPLEYLYLPPVLSRSDHAQDIGFILCVGGIFVYLLQLKSSRPARKMQSAQKFVPIPPRMGIRGWIYRPIFASLILFTLGLSIGYTSLLGLSAVLLLVLPGLVYRMIREDREQGLPRL
jgi:hypothetical protein